MTSDKKSEEQVREAIHRLMDKYHPGWDHKQNEFETFKEYQAWVTKCLDAIIILPADARRDH